MVLHERHLSEDLILEVVKDLGPSLALIPAEVTDLTNWESEPKPSKLLGLNMYTSPGHLMLPSSSTDCCKASSYSFQFLFYHLGAYSFYLENE